MQETQDERIARYARFGSTLAMGQDRTRYCHDCGQTLPGPLAERTHHCPDAEPARWIARGIPTRDWTGRVRS